MTASNLIERVRKAKTTVDELRRKRAELDGRKKQILDSLKANFQVEDLDSGTALLETMETELVQKEAALEAAVNELTLLLEKAGCLPK